MAEYRINSKKYGIKTVLMDDDMYNTITKCGYKLFLKKTETSNKFYVMLRTRQVKGKRYQSYLHRLIMNNPKDFTIDHINHNTLDNRRCNLRICSQFENNQNNSRTKIIPGVIKVGNRYKAYVCGKHLGTFSDVKLAIKARRLAERKMK